MKSKRRPFFFYKFFKRHVYKRLPVIAIFFGGVLAGLFLHTILMTQFSKWFIEGTTVLAANVSQDFHEIARR